MPNCPLRTKDDIKNIYDHYIKLEGFDSVISCLNLVG